MRRGVFYYHFNKREPYKTLLEQSVRSLRKHMPDLSVTVFGQFTHEDFDGIPVERFIVVPQPESGRQWEQKIMLLRDQKFYDEALFMDSDTYFLAPVWELFDPLEKYDLVATLEHHYFGKMRHLAPACMPELNYGMFLWRVNEETKKFFEAAHRIGKTRKRGCDQPVFRVAIWETGLKHMVVPWEYNCRYYFPCYLFEGAKILHSMSTDFEADAKMINEKAYPDYPPYKRVFTSTKMSLLKKRWARTQAPLDTVKETTYR